ncbi:uncharacterized protein TM35_000182160 [Trypanosoma theileri]|uniref:Uncharacterized protein n=1 Tax=Trypanosoma theileri TaxID=67003 RepID=A0A1X0NVD1_9TRYP|nr:uncharacterized protein TM35_000182160 [Trypanosoma theileri]ORC88159.1 hypothetical protein TM35_000182160 [Trypanosoma theileri]
MFPLAFNTVRKPPTTGETVTTASPLFLSRTLFSLPISTHTNSNSTNNSTHTPIGEEEEVIDRVVGSQSSSSTLMAFPLDGHHLFILCGTHIPTNNNNSSCSDRSRSSSVAVSTIFVVRFSAEGEPNATRRALPIAAISGCVQDRSRYVYKREERKSASTTGKDEKECEEERLVGTSSLTLKTSSGVESCSKFILGKEENENESIEKNKKETGVNTISSQQIHPFLIADAVMHAIWAVEVNTETLSAHVISPQDYWSLWNKCNHTTEKGISQSSLSLSSSQPTPQVWNQEKPEECLNSFVRPKALLGGVEGFVDGPFHLARFASPTALCWRIDNDDDDNDNNNDHHHYNNINDNTSSVVKGKKNNTSLSTVLFVSDTGNHAIRYVNFHTKLVRTVCGLNRVPGYRDGDYRVSQLHTAAALTWCSSGLLFIDTFNNAIRLLTGFDKTRRETTSQEKISINTATRVSEETNMGKRYTPRVWTVADGLNYHHNDNNNNQKEEEKKTKKEKEKEEKEKKKKKNKSPRSSNSKEVCWTSLNIPNAMTIMPDGSGVLFTDSSQDSLSLLSARGVETFIGPRDYSNTSLIPNGLIACSHILICYLISPCATPRTAFLVSSGVRQTVSLLLSCSNVKSKEEAFHLANTTTTIFSLFPLDTVKLQDGVLHKYIHGDDGKEEKKKKKKKNKNKNVHDTTIHESTAGRVKGTDANTVVITNNNSNTTNTSNGVNTVLVSGSKIPLYSPTQQDSSSLPISTGVTPSSIMSTRLEKAVQRLFDVYAYYATKDNIVPRSNKKLFLKDSNWLNYIDATYSLSLVGFWRFFTHAEYFTICTPLISSPCGEPVVDSTFTLSEDGDRIRWGMQDWRIVVDVLHQSSVKQIGYHVVSTMNFTFFCRVILLLYYCLQRQKEEEEEEEEEKEKKKEEEEGKKKKRREGKNKGEGLGEVHTLPLVSIDALSENEVINAYEDAVQRVEALHIDVSSRSVSPTMKSPSKEKEVEKDQQQQQLQQQQQRVGFLAADEVLQLLLRNEKPLRQLFYAYSKKTLIPDCDGCNSSSHTSFSNPTRERRITTLRQLRQMLTTGKDGKPKKKKEWVYVVPYNRFHALFRAVNVFPTLISESLLRRAFVDALAVPLFYRLNRERNATMQSQEDSSLFSFPLSHDVEKKYSRCGVALPFIPFLEAFTRVALTTFSLCGERDRQMYPTAAAKVEALMSWINRSFELGHVHENGATASSKKFCGHVRGGGSHHNDNGAIGEHSHMIYTTYPCQSSVPFPLDFISFNVPSRSVK